MENKLEKLIRVAYRAWKSDYNQREREHPDAETLACFLEDKLSAQEKRQIQQHLIKCANCAEVLGLELKAELKGDKDVPAELLGRMKNLVAEQISVNILEIFIKIKEKALEVLNTTGDILVGQELMPGAVLRHKGIKDFKDEVNILKDFKDTRVEVKVENKQGGEFNLSITAKEKSSQRPFKDLRISLFKDDLEIESYHTDSGRVTFEHILLGEYKVEISTLKDKLASILLNIRV